MQKTLDRMQLLDNGFVPYSGTVAKESYDKLGCPATQRKKAEWYVLPKTKNRMRTRYICLGCKKRCTEFESEHWPSFVLKNQDRPGRVIFMEVDRITVDELLNIKKVLRIDEAAYALNIGKTKVFEMLQDGRLEQVKGTPARVTTESVRRLLETA